MALVLLVGLVLGSSLAGKVAAVAEAEAGARGTGERVAGGAGGEGGGGEGSAARVYRNCRKRTGRGFL